MLKKCSVLFVDTHEDTKQTIEKNLIDRVENVYFATNGLDGLEKFFKYTPDIVISDFMIQNIEALEMIEKIKNVSKDTKIILIGAFNDIEIFNKFIDIEIDKYIKKPLNNETLLNTLNLLSSNILLKKEFNEQANLFKQYKETIDISNIVSKTDKKGIITYINDNFCNISGYLKEELIGKPHNIIRHPDMDSKIFDELWDTIQNKKKPWKGNIKNKKKNGDYYWVHTIINPILSEDGEILEYIGIRNDITEEMAMRDYFQDQLEHSNKQFKSALNLSKEYKKAINKSNIVSRTDINGKITYVNDNFVNIYMDIPKAKLKGKITIF
jgi:PAS domain S-box-containing protein